MRRTGQGGLALLALLAAAGPARAQDSRAEAVVAASKQAMGGAAWDRLEGCHETGSHGDGAIAYQTWFRLTGYGMRVEGRRGDSVRSHGFNGRVSWQASDGGPAQVGSGEAEVSEALTTAYVSSNGFFFADRFPATSRYLREAEQSGRRFDVVEIVPERGRALEYWFDRASHYLARVVDPRDGAVVEAGDYRRVGALVVAFSLTVHGPDGSVQDRGALTSLTCGPTDPSLFDPPRVPAERG
jgi:hypothetical protein